MSKQPTVARAYAIRINHRWSVFSLVLVSAVAVLIFFSASKKVSAVTKTWDGGGVSNVWQEAQNWSPDGVPAATDLVVFNGAFAPNGNKACQIVADVTVAGIQIGNYTATIAQSAALQVTNDYSQASGGFISQGPITIDGDFSLSGGVFVGGGAPINLPSGDFTISNGQFVSTTDVLTVGGNFTHTAGGVFTHNSGTVVFNGNASTIDVSTTESFNNLTFNANNGIVKTIHFADTLITLGLLNLTNGNINGGIVEAQAGVTHGGGFDGGISIVRITGTNTRTITLNAGGQLPDVSLDAANVTIDTSGTGTVTWDGSFDVKAGTVQQGGASFVLLDYFQSGGTFSGGSGNIAVNSSFNLSGGSFTSTTGTLSVARNFTHTAGVFGHGGGRVAFFSIFLGTINVPTTETFNILSFIADVPKTISPGDTLIATGTLFLTDGSINGGTVEAQAGVTHSIIFGGGSGTLAITGTATRTITINAPGSLPQVVLNAANVTMNTNGSGTSIISNFTLQAGTVQQGGGSFTLTSYTQTGGTFSGGSGNIALINSFSLSGGTFTSTTGTLFVGSSFTHAAGSFNHGGGTVTFEVQPGTINVPAVESFNDLTFLASKSISPGDTVIASGTLTLQDGLVTDGSLEAQGNVLVGSLFDGGGAALTFSGAVSQTLTNNGGVNPTGTWTVHKPSGSLSLASNLTLQPSQALNIISGILDQGASFNLTAGAIIIGAGGLLKNYGTGDLTLAGDLSNSGLVDLDGGGLGCGDPDSIVIRSSSAGTQRLWSGSGTFSLKDVDVQDQAGTASIEVLSGTNSGSNGANWAFNHGCIPTAVTLEAFNVTSYDQGVLLEWKTGFEADNLGFNIYREENGNRALVNSQLVAGSALTAGSSVLAGQSYSWWDPSIADCRLAIADCQNLVYWLEDVDLKGQSRLHGPIAIQKAEGRTQAAVQTAKTLATLGTGEARFVPVEFRASLAPSNVIALGKLQSLIADSPGTLKLQVKREGWYQVSGRELLGAGLPGIDPRNLQLFVDGKQQPITITGQEDGRLDSTDTLEFYGAGIDSPFTDLRTYYLIAAKQAGLRITTIDSSAHPSQGGSFEFTVERRDRSIYFSALRNGDKENFFGAIVASQPVNQTLTINHLSTSAGPATLTVALQGVTTVQHFVSLSLNGSNVGQLIFQGQALGEKTVSVPSSLLREGENQVTLTTQGGASDVSVVDHIRIAYQHSFTADDNLLKLETASGQQVTIGGFTNPEMRVFDVTDPYYVQELVGYISKDEAGEFAVSLTVPGGKGQHSLLALTKDKAFAAATIGTDHPSGLRNTAQGADLLIISRRELFDSLQRLKELRQKQGLAVMLVDIEDVYDEFGFGRKSPYAAREFLALASSSWKKKPRFVLFAGDASYDPKNYLGLGMGDLVPTKLVDTEFMETASDDWLADFDEDGIADLAIGRFPVRTIHETRLMVSKIIAYENSSPSQEVLLAADENDGFDFEAANTKLASLVPPSLRVTRVNRGSVGTETAKKDLLEGIIRGQKIVNYSGHGSANVWRGNLLTATDARELTNGHLPLFVMMTCLNGFFQDAAADSLAESLMIAEHGGAVAVWASSGMTLPGDQALINRELYRQLFNQTRVMTLGEAVMRAKSFINDPDIRRTWILLGDPAAKLR